MFICFYFYSTANPLCARLFICKRIITFDNTTSNLNNALRHYIFPDYYLIYCYSPYPFWGHYVSVTVNLFFSSPLYRF